MAQNQGDILNIIDPTHDESQDDNDTTKVVQTYYFLSNF
jgi:hypothetical protein